MFCYGAVVAVSEPGGEGITVEAVEDVGLVPHQANYQ